jgi:ferredoxin
MALISKSEKRKIPTYDNPNEVLAGKIEIDYEKCSGCLLCIKICPADALVMNNKKPVMVSLPKLNECMACGDCTAICPEQAISLKKSFSLTGFYKTIEHGDLLPPRL